MIGLFPQAKPGDLWCGLLEYPGVFVSAEGQVVSLRSGKARLLRGSRRGKYVALSAVAKGPYLHRVICEVFHGPAPVGCEVRHLDGNSLNNSAHNLAWGTRSENRADQFRHGTDPSGERNPMAKLTAVKVASMRSLRAVSGLSYRLIAEQFGVSTMTCYRAVVGQSWK